MARALPVISSFRRAAVAALWSRPVSLPFWIRYVVGSGALVVVGHIAGAPRAGQNPGCSEWGSPPGSQWPLLHHGLGTQHQVGLALVAEALVGRIAGCLRREHAGVGAGDHRYGIFGVVRLLETFWRIIS